MKKALLAVFALMVFGTSAYAGACSSGGTPVLCNWGDGKCWQIKSTDDSKPPVEVGCATQGGYCQNMYKGSESPDGSCNGKTPFTCNGCTWDDEATIPCDYGPILFDGTGGCFHKPAKDGCGTGGKQVTQAECDARNDQGPQQVDLCHWEGNANNNFDCYCGLVQGQPATTANCTNEYGVIVTDCAGKCPSSPILTATPKAQGLTVIPNGRSLYILSARDANVSLYDLAGNRVFSSKVSSGNNTVSLTQKQGVYYAVVTSGAQTQTVKVLLK
jgi:hypothetical protein